MEILLRQYVQSYKITGLSTVLADLAGYLAVGNVTPPIQYVRGRGQRKPGPTERRDIEWGVVYLRAVKEGRITDPHPTKTVAENYDVHPRTVQGWRSSVRVISSLSAMSPRVIERKMKQAAERYRGAGRSFRANNRRG